MSLRYYHQTGGQLFLHNVTKPTTPTEISCFLTHMGEINSHQFADISSLILFKLIFYQHCDITDCGVEKILYASLIGKYETLLYMLIMFLYIYHITNVIAQYMEPFTSYTAAEYIQ